MKQQKFFIVNNKQYTVHGVHGGMNYLFNLKFILLMCAY